MITVWILSIGIYVGAPMSGFYGQHGTLTMKFRGPDAEATCNAVRASILSLPQQLQEGWLTGDPCTAMEEAVTEVTQ